MTLFLPRARRSPNRDSRNPALAPVLINLRQLAAFIGLLCVLASSRAAFGEVLLRDSAVRISGTGSRRTRVCTILLQPFRTLGEELAPRLVLTTSGATRLSFGVEQP